MNLHYTRSITCKPAKARVKLRPVNKTPIRREGRSAPLDRHRLRTERMRAGLSQRRLAELTGLSTSQISRLEVGTCGVSPEALVRIAAALRCAVDDILLRRSA